MNSRKHPYISTVSTIGQIHRSFVNAMQEENPEKTGTFRNIYPPNGISQEAWNNN